MGTPPDNDDSPKGLAKPDSRGGHSPGKLLDAMMG